jgi:predicted metal-dependent RNase
MFSVLVIIPRTPFATNGTTAAGSSTVQAIIGKSNCHVMFCGYMAEGTLGAKIKSGRKTITIDGKSHRCNCGITTLNSFSSHANHYDLLKFALGLNCDKIALVHSNMSDRVEFKRHLDYNFNKIDKTTKVNCVVKGCSITL